MSFFCLWGTLRAGGDKLRKDNELIIILGVISMMSATVFSWIIINKISKLKFMVKHIYERGY